MRARGRLRLNRTSLHGLAHRGPGPVTAATARGSRSARFPAATGTRRSSGAVYRGHGTSALPGGMSMLNRRPRSRCSRACFRSAGLDAALADLVLVFLADAHWLVLRVSIKRADKSASRACLAERLGGRLGLSRRTGVRRFRCRADRGAAWTVFSRADGGDSPWCFSARCCSASREVVSSAQTAR